MKMKISQNFKILQFSFDKAYKLMKQSQPSKQLQQSFALNLHIYHTFQFPQKLVVVYKKPKRFIANSKISHI